MSIVGIWSGKNVLKHAFMAPDTMDKPGTSEGGVFISTKTILHDLGYRPRLVRAYYDPDGDGKIFPMVGQKDGSSQSPLFFNNVVPFMFFVDDITTTTVVFRTRHTLSLGGTFTFYYRIYRDPEV